MFVNELISCLEDKLAPITFYENNVCKGNYSATEMLNAIYGSKPFVLRYCAIKSITVAEDCLTINLK